MGQTGQNAKFVLNNGRAKRVDGSKRQIRAEQWGGPDGSDGSKRQIRAEMGQTRQNAKFVLNYGGAKRVEPWVGQTGQTGQHAKLVRVRRVKTPNSC